MKKKLNIGIVVGGLHPAVLGGKEKQAVDLATHLSQRNVVTVFTRYSPNNITSGIPYNLIQNKCPKVPGVRYFYDIIFFLLELARYRKKIDYLFCFGVGNDAVKGLLAYIFFGIPFSFSIRGPDSYQKASIFQRKIIEILVSKCNIIHVQTETIKKDFGHLIPNNKMRVIPNGINLSGRKYIEYSLRNNQIVFVGRMLNEKRGADKGVRYLIRGLEKIPLDTKCLLIGDGHDRVSLQKMASGKNVEFTGNVHPKKIGRHLSSSRILNLPSINEGFPNVIIEAMAEGTPVVATAVGGIQDILEHGKTGFLIEPKNPDQIADYNNKLLTDPDCWKKMSHNCLEKVKEYDWKNIVKEFEKMFSIPL